LGLQSLNFKWELAIGGQSPRRSLTASWHSIVQINGEWVELRSQDIKQRKRFFAARKDKLALSLEDAYA